MRKKPRLLLWDYAGSPLLNDCFLGCPSLPFTHYPRPALSYLFTHLLLVVPCPEPSAASAIPHPSPQILVIAQAQSSACLSLGGTDLGHQLGGPGSWTAPAWPQLL